METIDYLAIYLDDHRAGAAGGSSLARRIADQYGDRPEFEAAPDLADEIDADVEELDRLRARLDVDGSWQSHVKRLFAVVGEQVGRLKLNGHLFDSSPLSPVEELEGMAAGVFVKRGLWRTLRQLADDPAFADVLDPDELDRLIARADEQLVVLERLHERAVADLTAT
ncbi:MAG: hypothetical protein CL424_19765 [Acidimicrobiaceae bacterium]|nr:hypothetical protein [Acidimicrobiaceae bacterium]